MMYARKQQGFTLIEVLLALTVSGLLLALLSQAFHQVTAQWETRFSTIQEDAHNAYRRHLIARSLRYTVPFVTPDSDNSEPLTIFFSGNTRSVRWMTAKPVWEKGIAIATLQLEPTQSGDSVNLVYHEQPLASVFPGHDVPTEKTSNRFVMKVNTNSKIDYLGYKNLDERLNLNTQSAPVPPQWSPRFSGEQRQLIPLAVRVSDAAGDIILQSILPNTDTHHLRTVN